MDKPNKPAQRLNPLNDYLFLKTMGEKGDEEQLLAFLNAVLGRSGSNSLKSIEILGDRNLSAEVIGDKSSVLDVRAQVEDDTRAITDAKARANTEVQLRNLGNMDRRSLYYWSREYSKGLKAGQDYRELPKVITINIVDFEYFTAGGFHTCFHLWEDRERELMLTDALEIHFIEMAKFRRLGEKDIKHDALHRWLTWLDRDSSEEEIREVLNMDRAIQRANERTAYVAQDKESLHAYEMREMALSDWTSGLNHARREGRQEGLREGEQRGLQKGEQKIIDLLKSGKSPEEIIRNYSSNGQ